MCVGKNHCLSTAQRGASKYISENAHSILLHASISCVIYSIENGYMSCKSQMSLGLPFVFAWVLYAVGECIKSCSCPHTIGSFKVWQKKQKTRRNLQWQFSGSEFAMTEVGFKNVQGLSAGSGFNEIRRPSELWGAPYWECARKEGARLSMLSLVRVTRCFPFFYVSQFLICVTPWTYLTSRSERHLTWAWLCSRCCCWTRMPESVRLATTSRREVEVEGQAALPQVAPHRNC